jgi:hypothetical protein
MSSAGAVVRTARISGGMRSTRCLSARARTFYNPESMVEHSWWCESGSLSSACKVTVIVTNLSSAFLCLLPRSPQQTRLLFKSRTKRGDRKRLAATRRASEQTNTRRKTFLQQHRRTLNKSPQDVVEAGAYHAGAILLPCGEHAGGMSIAVTAARTRRQFATAWLRRHSEHSLHNVQWSWSK